MLQSPRREPLKWIKYLLLVQFGFVKREELERDIRRYSRAEQRQVIRDIRADLLSEGKHGRRYLYVIKLVSTELSGRLPNLRVEGLEDLKGVSRFFADHEQGSHVEIWFCRTRVDENVLSVAGRFVFTPRDGGQEQSVEQVWRCSPRLLEQVSDTPRYPYLRASRYSWGWPYSVEDVRLPTLWGVDRSGLINEFLWSMRLFERERETTEVFLAFLDSFGLRAYSIEYKIVGSKLTIIDWDTPDDRLIVTNATRIGC
jgi:hypothetical protein